MIIAQFRKISEDEYTTVSASLQWEQSDRTLKTHCFQTDLTFEKDLSHLPEAFLVASFLQAIHFRDGIIISIHDIGGISRHESENRAFERAMRRFEKVASECDLTLIPILANTRRLFDDHHFWMRFSIRLPWRLSVTP